MLTIIIICIPPYTFHKLRPLDLAFMAPFKTDKPAKNVSIHVEIAANGFRKPGIHPFNRNVFKESDLFLIECQERTPAPPAERSRARTPSLSTVWPEETAPLSADIEPLPLLENPQENSGNKEFALSQGYCTRKILNGNRQKSICQKQQFLK